MHCGMNASVIVSNKRVTAFVIYAEYVKFSSLRFLSWMSRARINSVCVCEMTKHVIFIQAFSCETKCHRVS